MKLNLYNRSKHAWIAFVLAGGLLAGSLLLSLLGDLVVGLSMATRIKAFILAAGLASGVLTLCALAIKRPGQIIDTVRDGNRRLSGAIAVRGITGPLPLSLGGWAIEPDFAALIARIVIERRPALVVECGSGYSTVLIATLLRQIGEGGRVLSLDAEAHYAQVTRDLLRTFGVEGNAEVVEAPIQLVEVDSQRMPWYGINDTMTNGAKIDLLIVDGPPATIGLRARYPAVPVLRSLLSPDAIILMDDGNRPDERWIASRWADELNFDVEFENTATGAWMLRSKK